MGGGDGPVPVAGLLPGDGRLLVPAHLPPHLLPLPPLLSSQYALQVICFLRYVDFTILHRELCLYVFQN